MSKRKTRSSNENRGVTIADVAKAAGVSVPTVSRILNNKEYVADETRQRVHEVIQKLGYAPHTQARRLRGGASMTLALHHPIESPHELTAVIETPYLTGAAAAASERDYFLHCYLLKGCSICTGAIRLMESSCCRSVWMIGVSIFFGKTITRSLCLAGAPT